MRFNLPNGDSYRDRAEECRRLARIAPEYLRGGYIELAATYDKLALSAETKGQRIPTKLDEETPGTRGDEHRSGMGFYFSPYLDGFDGDPETKRVLGVAIEITRVARGIRDHYADRLIAKRIIELAKAGERNADRLCEGALEKLRGHLYGD